MRKIYRNCAAAAGLLLLAGAALAQNPDWYEHRNERFHGEGWRAHMFAEIREDLDHVQATAFTGRDEFRIARTKEELNELQADLAAHRYSEAKLDEVIGTMQHNASLLARRIEHGDDFELVGPHGNDQLPLVAFRLKGERNFDEFDLSFQLAAERGWMVPAYSLPPNADHVTICRVLCKETLGQPLIETLHGDVMKGLEVLDTKGGFHDLDRKKVKTGTGY